MRRGAFLDAQAGGCDFPAVNALLAVDLNPIRCVANAPAGHALRRRLEQGGALSLAKVSAPAQPFVAALIRELLPQRTLVVVTDDLRTQESFQQDIETWSRWQSFARGTEAPAAILFHPAWDILPHEAKLPQMEVISERLQTLVALAGHAPDTIPAPTVVTSVGALLQRTFSRAEIGARTRRLRRGDTLDPLDLVEWLEEQAYEPEAQVNHKGEIALRGGIVDVFPLTSPWPVRLEFFGNELESLRTFDPLTQVSREVIETVEIPPAGELGLLKRTVAAAAAAAEGATASTETAPPQLATLLDHLPANTIFLLANPEALAEHARGYREMLPDGDVFHLDWPTFLGAARERGMTLAELDEPELVEGIAKLAVSEAIIAASENEGMASRAEFLSCESLDAFRPVTSRAPDPAVAEAQRREFFAQLHRWLRQGRAVHLFCNNDGERQRFTEVWAEYGFNAAAASPEAVPLFPEVHLGALSRGFLCEEARLVVVTDAEVFGRYKVQSPRRLKAAHAATTRSLLDTDFRELEDGDYVVHLQHGIGRFLGLQKLPAGGGERPLEKAGALAAGTQESLVIEYASRDPDQPAPKLYVPVSEAHLVSKYVGAGKARPVLNTLGGTRWAKAKAGAEIAVRDLAAELLAMQAARATQAGYAFGADTSWQREFESAFLFEETPDQMRAIVAAKADMETPRPMDRLVCGDVGFGKTEVAIRAAFKAVMGGRQVAMLVPTTVLAQQHFNTFRERVADYPVRVELLSRFRTRREQQRVIQDLATGAVDIVIGTHRLLQQDIAFKELGLVVIDEEQRFGVMHKEKLKLLRRLVDVLTLTATPIPRTLYQALVGARDMSTIETPPVDRLPVETIVCGYDERVIRDAIQREMNRGGQVFFLHNRVQTIDTMAVKLRALVPKARLVVGHGQMKSDELEEVMTRFVNGEADVLLSTTIIESGLDIPNANTILIDRADRFGLSELYQLRGRVGRFKHQAYAYLLIPRHARLLTDARKRISALKQYSTLGSGFKIAMRDLEIRGAGNLLGPEQSGHITAVGFDLYCKLLQHSVASLKGEKVKPREDVALRLDFVRLNVEEMPVSSEKSAGATRRAQRAEELNISVPRETAIYVSTESHEVGEAAKVFKPIERATACLPSSYIAEPSQRIQAYRKLAELVDEEGVGRLKAELRDRFGPLPASVELLLQVAVLKLAAGERGLRAVETREDRLMLQRGEDYITLDGKFPRLTKRTARARVQEILRLVRALPSPAGR